MRIAIAILCFPVLAWAQAPLEAPKPRKRDPKAPVVRKAPPTAGEVARKENRQLDGVSKTMKKRPAADNSVPNQR